MTDESKTLDDFLSDFLREHGVRLDLIEKQAFLEEIQKRLIGDHEELMEQNAELNETIKQIRNLVE